MARIRWQNHRLGNKLYRSDKPCTANRYLMIKGVLLHSVSYSGSWGQQLLPLETFIDKAADLGFQGIELMAKRPHLSLLDYGSREYSALRRRIEDRKLKHVCLAAYTNFTADAAHAEIPHAEMQVHYLAELARAAKELGAEAIRVFTGYEESASPFDRQWNVVVKCLREASQRAAEFGVVLGVQNHHDIANDFESLRDLISEIDQPNCRAMFDAWAPALQGEDIARAARDLASMTVHTTVADYQLRSRYRYVPALVNYERQTPRAQAVPMGEGSIDYGSFFDALCSGGFNGTVAYEMCSPLRGGGTMENLDRYARAFLEYMSTYMRDADQAGRGCTGEQRGHNR